MNKNKIKSFCKVNLSLRVIKKLTNNYHIIKSFITFCNIYDLIKIKKIKGDKDKVIFTGKFKKGISNKQNTVTKLLYSLRKKNLIKKQSFEINIKKNIPPGAGLGGGSSNAAYLLKFLNSNMSLNLNKLQVQKIAKEIGFDVPIILERKNTLLTGKKNQIIRINKKFQFIILIVYPNINCSTKIMYKKNRKFTKLINRDNFNKITRDKALKYLINENNDLEEIVIKSYPQIGKIINFMKMQKGCYFSRITGSGSACIGIYSNIKLAICAQKLIKIKFPKYWCVLSRTI